MLSSTNVQTTAHIRKLSTLQIHTYAIGYRCLTVKKIKTSSTHKNQSKWLDDTKKKSNYANQIKQPKAPVCIKQAVCPVKQITQQLKTEFNFLFWNEKKKEKRKEQEADHLIIAFNIIVIIAIVIVIIISTITVTHIFGCHLLSLLSYPPLSPPSPPSPSSPGIQNGLIKAVNFYQMKIKQKNSATAKKKKNSIRNLQKPFFSLF